MDNGVVLSINLSSEKGVVKKPVESGELVIDGGLKGDAHSGDGIRQLSLLNVESYCVLPVDMQKQYGVFAENITIDGLRLDDLPIGTTLAVGEAVVEITQIGKECHGDCDIMKAVGRCEMPKKGVFARVIKSSIVKCGDLVTIINKK